LDAWAGSPPFRDAHVSSSRFIIASMITLKSDGSAPLGLSCEWIARTIGL
jgi:hypothetical protein